jgi:hypothetical protein
VIFQALYCALGAMETLENVSSHRFRFKYVGETVLIDWTDNLLIYNRTQNLNCILNF